MHATLAPESQLLEVKSGTLHTPDGHKHEVHGGAYLTPEAYLRTSNELSRLRESEAEAAASNALPVLLVGAGLLGLAAGFWLGRRGDD